MSAAGSRTAAGTLAADYPGWHIWRGRDDAGAPRGWYATRHGQHLSAQQVRAGLFMTVAGDTEEELRGQLEAQAQRETAP